jgi:hypothetical protein
MSETDLERAKRTLAIQDVYVCEAKAWADRALDPLTPIQQVGAQFRVAPQPNVEIFPTTTTTPDPTPIHFFVRYFVETGLRIVKPGVDSAKGPELEQSDLLSEITATFIVRYACLEQQAPTQAMLQSFSDHAVHHMWPYWREFLHATTSRLRLPGVILPTRNVKQQSADEGAPGGALDAGKTA